ncbi:MAG: hypothetical protein J6V44_12820 [Methanobrevibacter sp.]|nr:hypothetical protein [Methanobrevibacter sp.]
MNSKTDQAIKRYLKSISTNVHKAKCNNSIYYYLSEDEEIRFSDHTGMKPTPRSRILDIIKCTEHLYRFKIDQLEIVVEAHVVIPYLKSLVLLGPWIKPYSVKLNESFVKQSKQIIKMQNTIDKLQHDSDIVDSVFDDNRKLNTKIRELKHKINELGQANDKLNKRYTQLKAKCDNFINFIKQVNE